jgi:hypothetical protein
MDPTLSNPPHPARYSAPRWPLLGLCLGLLASLVPTPTPTRAAIEIAIRPGSEAGGLNVRSSHSPGDTFDFRTCEGVITGSRDLGLFQVRLPAAFGDGNQSWRQDGPVWSYTWYYPPGLEVRVRVEPEGDTLKLGYTLRNTGTNALESVQLHTCIPTTEAPGFFPPRNPAGGPAPWSELYQRLHVWSADRRFTLSQTRLAPTEPHLALMQRGAPPVQWAWWVNTPETFDPPLIALSSRDHTRTLALAFQKAVWASSNTGDDRACFHLFPWFGHIAPGSESTVTGRLYILPGGPNLALGRYRADFPAPPTAPSPLVSRYVPDPATWRTPPIRPEGFQFEIQISSLGTDYDPERVRRSIREHDLGEYESAISTAIAAEWGYSFTHLDGQQDGAGRRIRAGYPTPPATRADCLPVIEAFLQRQYIDGAPHPWASMNGHFPWHHYAGEFGFDQLGSEIGENINNYQWHLALNRGAARQYRRPWFIDFSAWHGPSITDYSHHPIWGEHSGPDHGHSMSLFERSLFLAYMSGAGQITAEAGGAIAFLPTPDARGIHPLSPYGDVCRRFHAFTLAHPDPGIPLTPCGIVLDRLHGAYPGFGHRKAFWHFDYTAGDHMTWNLIDLLWPGGWEVMGRNETGTLVHGPFGDTFDVLLQNAPSRVLESYPCLVLSGDPHLSPEEVDRLSRYAEQGGTLILNTAHLHAFPRLPKPPSGTLSHTQPVGRGRLIVHGPDHQISALGPILRQELSRHLPVTVSPGVHHLVNLRPSAILVTLLNDEGVTKEFRKPAVVDRSKAHTATVQLHPSHRVRSVRELRTQRPLPMTTDQSVQIHLPPGELAILEFQLD